nr:hypothetical protein [Tanacetum cinerariifolium]
YYAVATGATPPKPKASVRKTRSSSDTTLTPPTVDAGLRLTNFEKGKQASKASKAKSLSALFEVAMTEAQQLKLATKRSLQQTHISEANGSGADEGSGTIPGVLDVPTDESEEEISWNSTDEEGDDEGKDDDDDDDDDDEQDDDEAQDDDDHEDEGNDETDEEEGSNDGQAFDEEEFINPSLSTHAEEETRDEESFDPILITPEHTDYEGNGEENLGTNSSSVSSQFMTSMLNPTPDAGVESIFETTSQMDVQTLTSFAGAVSSILEIVQRYMDQQMNEVVKVAVQIQSDRLCNEAQADNDKFLKTTDENMQKIIKEQIKEQVKLQVSKILPKIKQTMNEQLEAYVLTRSSNSSKTSYAVVADLPQMELKKILIEKMEGNKSIHGSNEQRNLYKALVEAYESDKIILDTYGDTVTLKRRRDDDADKDKEPSAGSDQGSKRRREGKEPESASAPKEKFTKSAEKSTQGSKS